MKKRTTPTQFHPDQLQLALEDRALIEVPAEPEGQPGTMDFDQRVRGALTAAIKASPYSREQIADMLTGLVGREISKTTLDTYTGQGRPNKLPADLLPALTVILGPDLMNALAEPAGGRFMLRDEVKLARLGQIYLFTRQADQEISRLIADTPLFRGAGHVDG